MPQSGPMPVGPSIRMRECIPEQMSRDSQQNGTHDQHESSRPTETKFADFLSQSALNVFRQESDRRRLDERVKEPQHHQCQWKSQEENSREGVAVAPIRSESNEIFVVRRKCSDQQSGWHKPKP